MTSRVRYAMLAAVLFGASTAGCGSGDDGAGTTSAAPAPATTPLATTAPAPATTAPPPAPAPGTVTLDLSGVTDATGLVMLAIIGKTVPVQAFAAVCGLVDTDPFSFTGAYLPITGDDPCTLGTEPVEFDPGSYQVIVAVLQGGSRSPEQCTQTEVTVDGDATVEVIGLGPPTDCDF